MPTTFPTLSPDDYRARLTPPALGGPPLPVVIDTDAANEIDDQFAIAWALRSPARLDIRGWTAAPFSFAHRRGQGAFADVDAPPYAPPGVGMARSADEIVRMHELLGVAHAGRVFHGVPGYLAADGPAPHCDAVDHLIATARALPATQPLYVVVLGCPTNVAAALLRAPDLVQRIVVVWTSGYPSHAPQVNDSFNLEQDLRASRVLLDSGVPLVYLPGFHVGAQLRLSRAEADRELPGRGRIGDALYALFADNPLWTVLPRPADRRHSWVLWDLICIAWLLQPAWVPGGVVPVPRLDDARRWQPRAAAHPMFEAHAVDRDAVLNAFFDALPPRA